MEGNENISPFLIPLFSVAWKLFPASQKVSSTTPFSLAPSKAGHQDTQSFLSYEFKMLSWVQRKQMQSL